MSTWRLATHPGYQRPEGLRGKGVRVPRRPDPMAIEIVTVEVPDAEHPPDVALMRAGLVAAAQARGWTLEEGEGFARLLGTGRAQDPMAAHPMIGEALAQLWADLLELERGGDPWAGGEPF